MWLFIGFEVWDLRVHGVALWDFQALWVCRFLELQVLGLAGLEGFGAL